MNNRLTILVIEQQVKPAGGQVIVPAPLVGKSRRSGDCWSVTDGWQLRRSEPARLDAPATAMIKSVIVLASGHTGDTRPAYTFR